MAEPFKAVSLQEFENMTRPEREAYIDALIAHLQALRAISPPPQAPKKKP